MVDFKTFLESAKKGGYVNFFAATDITKPKGSRHRANIIRDVGTRKHARTVPKYLQPDPAIILKVEKLKGNMSHYEPINNIQLKEICKKYKIYSITKTEPKKLGNTGIFVVWDSKLKTFAIKK